MQLSDTQRWFLWAYGPVAVLCLVVLVVAVTHLERVADRPETPEETASDTARAVTGMTEPEAEPEGHVLGRLIIPVEGVDSEELVDTFTDGRGGGRAHEAIDIMAERGTPVIAAAAGTIAEIHESEAGGKSLYKVGRDSTYVFYYAHLESYAPDLAVGMLVHQGQELGSVGSTGNAPADTPHLHFAIWALDDPSWVWAGEAINPYPLLSGVE